MKGLWLLSLISDFTHFVVLYGLTHSFMMAIPQISDFLFCSIAFALYCLICSFMGIPQMLQNDFEELTLNLDKISTLNKEATIEVQSLRLENKKLASEKVQLLIILVYPKHCYCMFLTLSWLPCIWYVHKCYSIDGAAFLCLSCVLYWIAYCWDKKIKS